MDVRLKYTSSYKKRGHLDLSREHCDVVLHISHWWEKRLENDGGEFGTPMNLWKTINLFDQYLIFLKNYLYKKINRSFFINLKCGEFGTPT